MIGNNVDPAAIRKLALSIANEIDEVTSAKVGAYLGNHKLCNCAGKLRYLANLFPPDEKAVEEALARRRIFPGVANPARTRSVQMAEDAVSFGALVALHDDLGKVIAELERRPERPE